MNESTPKRVPAARARGIKIVLWMIALTTVPALLTLNTAGVQRKPVALSPPDTRYGYTVSLLIFVIPLAALLPQVLRNPRGAVSQGLFDDDEPRGARRSDPEPPAPDEPNEAVEYARLSDARLRNDRVRGRLALERRAFLYAMLTLIPQGFVLDILGGTYFFHFKNTSAVVGLWVPVMNGRVPVEEFLFYALGFLTILTSYVWFCRHWMRSLSVELEPRERKIFRQGFDPWSLAVCVALVTAGVLYKNLFAPGLYRGGFPTYFAVLVAVALFPTIACMKEVEKAINWRAFSLTGALLITLSVIWEGTLAGPYQWWGYHERHMLGWVVHAWSDLPFEAVIVWFAVTWATVVYYEMWRLILFQRRLRTERLELLTEVLTAGEDGA